MCKCCSDFKIQDELNDIKLKLIATNYQSVMFISYVKGLRDNEISKDKLKMLDDIIKQYQHCNFEAQKYYEYNKSLK